MNSNPFSVQTNNLPLEKIIDRENELDDLLTSVVERCENVLLLGDNGIGKTCLLRKLRHKLQSLNGGGPEIIEVEAREIRKDSTDFMERILSSLFKHSWSKLAGKPFTELMFGLSIPEDIEYIGVPAVRTLMRLYQHFRSDFVAKDTKTSSSLGANAIVKAHRQKDRAQSFRQEGLKPWEYTELMGEVLVLLRERTASRVLIFADETNHIDPELQVDIFRSNLDSFLRRDVQFIFTARKDVLQQVPSLRDAFLKVFVLEGFPDKATFMSLIGLYLAGEDSPVPFSDRALDRIWTLTTGHPTRLQRLCQESYTVAQKEKALEVAIDHVFEATLKIGQWELR